MSTHSQKVDERQLEGQIMAEKLKQCAKCGEIKPINQFNKRLTLAQSRAFLQNPNIRTRYTTQSKNCRDCQRQLRRRKPLTQDQIRTKISTGDMHPLIGEARLKQMREDIPKVRSRIMKEYWQGKKNLMTVERKKAIQQRVAQYGNRYKSYKNAIKANPNATPTQHAMLEQHRLNYLKAKEIRDDIFKKLELGEVLPKDLEGSKLNELFTRRKQ